MVGSDRKREYLVEMCGFVLFVDWWTFRIYLVQDGIYSGIRMETSVNAKAQHWVIMNQERRKYGTGWKVGAGDSGPGLIMYHSIF